MLMNTREMLFIFCKCFAFGGAVQPEACVLRQTASGITLTLPSETVTYPEVPAVGVQTAAGVVAAEI